MLHPYSIYPFHILIHQTHILTNSISVDYDTHNILDMQSIPLKAFRSVTIICGNGKWYMDH